MPVFTVLATGDCLTSISHQAASDARIQGQELVKTLEQQNTSNPEQIDLEAAITMMTKSGELKLKL